MRMLHWRPALSEHPPLRCRAIHQTVDCSLLCHPCPSIVFDWRMCPVLMPRAYIVRQVTNNFLPSASNGLFSLFFYPSVLLYRGPPLCWPHICTSAAFLLFILTKLCCLSFKDHYFLADDRVSRAKLHHGLDIGLSSLLLRRYDLPLNHTRIWYSGKLYIFNISSLDSVKLCFNSEFVLPVVDLAWL